jgi:hypothetical protein
MQVESLGGLRAAFEAWRSRKRHPREPVPAELLERARAAARHHGWAATARAAKVERARLETGRRRGGGGGSATGVPPYSRVELAAPTAVSGPFAEVEMPSGLKVRLFTGSHEALGLLSSLLGAGGPR